MSDNARPFIRHRGLLGSNIINSGTAVQPTSSISGLSGPYGEVDLEKFIPNPRILDQNINTRPVDNFGSGFGAIASRNMNLGYRFPAGVT